jgi:citrate lyase subunit alpha/citrate CoA-transferase
VPSFRDRVPIIVDEVTTLCGPSELIDVIVTERGIAINPRRTDLLKRVAKSSLPVRSLKDIQREVYAICSAPAKPHVDRDNVIAVVKWVDGTLLDSVYQIEK